MGASPHQRLPSEAPFLSWARPAMRWGTMAFLTLSVPASPYLLQNEYCYYYYDTSAPSSLLLFLPGVAP